VSPGLYLGDFDIFAGEVQFERPKDVSTAQNQFQEIQKAIENWNSDKVTGAMRRVFFRWDFDPTLPLQNDTAVNAHGYVVGLPWTRLF
jgi:hypothetical protein